MKENYGKTGTGVEIGMNDTIIKELKESYQNKYPSSRARIRLPSQIKFVEKEGKIEMVLMEEAIGINMQNDSAAFEGWAVILKRYLEKDIKLDIAVPLNFDELKGKFESNGHFMRFLYRVLRFQGQYSKWFSLSENLNTIMGRFHDWLETNKEDLINNIPKQDNKELNNDKISERRVEEMMAGKENILHKIIENADSEGNEIFRQLPVGLFSDGVEAENGVFVGGNAAVDLWTWDGDKFYAFELKYNENKKVGIIAEIFFYSNYLYDLLVEKYFTLNKESTEKRGYHNLLENDFKEICTYMLVDEIHPLIDEKVLEILNENKSANDIKISYKMQKYKIENGTVSWVK